MESKLTKEWQEYDGDYEKAMQDIRLKNGDEVMMCWPNAGLWVTMRDGPYSKKDIKNSEVTHVRKTYDKKW